MRSGKPIYYWDACLFLAWMNDEKREAGDMDGLAEVVAMIDSQECYIVTSVNTRAEVLDSSMNIDAQKKFSSLLHHPSFTFTNVSLPISELTGQIRDFYRARKPQYINVKLPDATHLATAIAFKVDEFHTFDVATILRFNGNVADFPLKLCKPSAIQKKLFP